MHSAGITAHHFVPELHLYPCCFGWVTISYRYKPITNMWTMGKKAKWAGPNQKKKNNKPRGQCKEMQTQTIRRHICIRLWADLRVDRWLQGLTFQQQQSKAAFRTFCQCQWLKYCTYLFVVRICTPNDIQNEINDIHRNTILYSGEYTERPQIDANEYERTQKMYQMLCFCVSV